MENKNIIYYEELDSTNTKAAELAEQGAEHGTVILADRQTAGKGRRGRRWESPSEENVYMSVLLRPEIEPSMAPMLTLVMAHSVAEVLQAKGFSRIQIKWPNDLVLSGRKVCGILTEMRLRETKIDYVIVGVGINVNAPHFPQELSDKATSLYLESGKKWESRTLAEEIARHFEQSYEQFMKTGDLSFLREQYNALLLNTGKEVRIMDPGREYTAFAEGINEKGELLVRTQSGEQKNIYAGEVSVRGVYGYV